MSYALLVSCQDYKPNFKKQVLQQTSNTSDAAIMACEGITRWLQITHPWAVRWRRRRTVSYRGVVAHFFRREFRERQGDKIQLDNVFTFHLRIGSLFQTHGRVLFVKSSRRDRERSFARFDQHMGHQIITQAYS